MQVNIDMAASEQHGRAPLSAWYALAILVLTTIFAFVDRQILNLVMPSLQKSLGLSDLQLGALQGLGLAIFASVASYPMGWLADRYGRRLLLVAGIVIWSISTAACAFQTSFVGLFVATIGIAVGEAGLMPIIFALIPDLFRSGQRNLANFVYFASTILGGALGVALGGAALGWLGSHPQIIPSALAGLETWRAAVLIVALPAPIFIILVALLPLRRRAPEPAQKAQSDAAAAATDFLPFVRLHRRTFAYVFGGIAGYCLPLSAAYGWLPVAVFRAFGLPPAAAGVQMGGAMGIASILGVAMPTAALRFFKGEPITRALRLGRILIMLAVVPTLLLPWATSAAVVFAAAAAQLSLCIGVAALMPGVVQDISPPALRSRILSLVGIVLALGHALSPLLVGAISGAVGGSRSVLFALAAVGVAGICVTILCFTLALEPLVRTGRAARP
jgi:MFS family permease